MLYFDRFYVFEKTDVNKTSAPKECDVCHYCCFLHCRFKFQQNVCNRCHGLLMMSMNYNNIAILSIQGSDYCYIISLIGRNAAINLMQNADLIKQSGTLLYINFFFHI